MLPPPLPGSASTSALGPAFAPASTAAPASNPPAAPRSHSAVAHAPAPFPVPSPPILTPAQLAAINAGLPPSHPVSTKFFFGFKVFILI
jgi:hypothetical protein